MQKMERARSKTTVPSRPNAGFIFIFPHHYHIVQRFVSEDDYVLKSYDNGLLIEFFLDVDLRVAKLALLDNHVFHIVHQYLTHDGRPMIFLPTRNRYSSL